MKGVILCGGKGTKLYPISYTIPKELIPIANKPLIVYTIELLLNAGVDEIAIVVNEGNKLIFEKILSNYLINKLKYIVKKNPDGIVHAMLSVREFVNQEKFILVLGDNSFDFDLKNFIMNFINNKENCRLLLKKVKNPEKYVVAYVADNRIISLEEKPKIAYSDLIVTGLYAFDDVIFKVFEEIKPSSCGEYEITDAVNLLLYNGHGVGYEILESNWRAVENPIEVIEENIYRLSNIDENIMGQIVNSHISGKVILGNGSVVYNSIVRGPVNIGENTTIKNSYIGPYTSISNGVNIEKSNIENSIILEGATIREIQNTIDYSILGEGSMIINERGLKKVNRLILGRHSKVYLSNY